MPLTLSVLLAKTGVRSWVLTSALLLLLVGLAIDLAVFRRPWDSDPEAGKSKGDLITEAYRRGEMVQEAGDYMLRRVFEHLELEEPVAMQQGPDGRWFLISKMGKLHMFEDDFETRTTTVLLDLGDRVDLEHAEQGLLGMALHPNFEDNGRLFLYYSAPEPRRTQLVEYTMAPGDPNRLDPASERVLLSVAQPMTTHNGGGLAFGPDGMLYLSIGDGGGFNDPTGSAQVLDRLLAKILRIDVDRRDGELGYAIPPDNPFVDVAGARPEIWALGLRNTWRFTFDRETGVMWAGDVGERSWEEINQIVRGGNYGWPFYEGKRPFLNNPLGIPRDIEFIPPVWEYSHEVGAAVIGGYVYHGQRLPELQGSFLFADYIFGTIWALDWQEGGTAEARVLSRQPKNVNSFAERLDGELYMTTNEGSIFELVPRQPPPSPDDPQE